MCCWTGSLNYLKHSPLPRGASQLAELGSSLPWSISYSGSNWSDLTGQGKGKIALHKMIIQFLCKRNKSPLLPHTSPAVSSRPLWQRNRFYDGSGAFIMTAKGTNTAQHQTAWELWFQAKCNKRRELSYTREMKTVSVDYGGSIMFSLQRI